MISVMVASAVYLVALQASVNAPRNAFADCLKQATQKAQSEKVAADAFEAYAKGQCAGQVESFKKAVVSFDVKNGISRKEAAENADLQVEDYMIGSVDSYRMKTRGANPQQAQQTQPGQQPTSPQ